MPCSSVEWDEIHNCLKVVRPLFAPMVEQLRGDWTSTEGKDEKVQTFRDFPMQPVFQAKEGDHVEVLSIGGLPAEIPFQELRKFVAAYFCIEVVLQPNLDLDVVPQKAWRSFGGFVRQIDATCVLTEVLTPLYKNDPGYRGIVALTTEDLLYDMNDPLDYVYGLSHKAAPGDTGVAVVSTKRLWRPDAVGSDVCTRRLFKLLTHEIGHLFHIAHCLNHACNMNGVETVDQLDRHPLELCPECMAKVCWVSKTHPTARYARLAAVSKESGLTPEADLYQRCLGALTAGRQV